MYVQLVPTFKTCSWKQHTQYNCDNGFTPHPLPKKKGNFAVTDFLFSLYFIVEKLLLFKRVQHLDTGYTEREHRS